MCVLLIGYRLRADLPLVVAANRDEAYARPATGPRRVMLGNNAAFMPQDLSAGGTWLGIAQSGLVVVITNRRDGPFDPGRPSRGQLCQRMLAQQNADEVAEQLELALSQERYNSFNLFYADPKHAFVSSWNGELTSLELEPGTHALSNEHGVGELEVTELRELPWKAGSWLDLRKQLLEILGSRRKRDARGYRIFKQGEHYGTVSSSLIRYERGGELILEYTATPRRPSMQAFEQFRLPIEAGLEAD